MNPPRAAWLFLAPALLVLGLFFLLPVIAALVLSLTDYDLYALADIRNLRFVALGNYWELLHRPLFWSALGHTLYFVIAGVPLSLMAAACDREKGSGPRSTTRPSGSHRTARSETPDTAV